ncbi:MAG: alginate export family protein [Rhodospirillales bacterium]|nr:alginate export family protein [Rhodospirillales bacterium]
MRLDGCGRGAAALALALAAWLGAAPAAQADSPQINLLDAGPGQFFVTGEGLSGLIGESWFTPTPSKGVTAQHSYTFNQNTVRLGVGYRVDGVTFYVQGIATSLLGLPTNAISPYPQGQNGIGAGYYAANHVRNGFGAFIKQANVSLDPKQFGGVGLTAGRYEFDDGTEIMPTNPDLHWLVVNQLQQRLLGSRYVLVGGRSFDGARGSFGDNNRNITAMWGIPTEGAYLLNGGRELPGVDAGYLSFNAGPGQLPGPVGGDSLARLFVLQYDDTRGFLLPSNQTLAQRKANNGAVRVTTIGGHYVKLIHTTTGSFDLLLWGAWQTGSWGQLAQNAYAYIAEAGYHLTAAPWQPWLRFGYTVASGDNNPNNRTNGTFFPVLPTPWYTANFAFYTMSNIDDAHVELLTFPTPALEWRIEAHALSLNSSKDQWYAGGGAWNDSVFGYQPRPSHGMSDLATLAETRLRWQVNSHLSLSAYYGHAFGGAVVAANYPKGQAGDFGILLARWQL